jgi:beta-ureidopropionase / N-carbamoyl-L-amino-acid hydrolase
LAANKIDIGVVEGIVGNRRWDVTNEGKANHAGTTPMNQRQDAMLAAAKFIEAVNRVVTSVPGAQVGTVGSLQAFPGAYNVVAGKVVLGLDIRNLDDTKIDSMFAKIHEEADQIGRASGTKFSFEQLVDDLPALTDPRAANRRGLRQATRPDHKVATERSNARRTKHRADRADRNDLCAERRRNQPRAARVYKDVINGANVVLRSVLALDAQNW